MDIATTINTVCVCVCVRVLEHTWTYTTSQKFWKQLCKKIFRILWWI